MYHYPRMEWGWGHQPFTLKFCAQNQCPPSWPPLSWLGQGHGYQGPGTRGT